MKICFIAPGEIEIPPLQWGALESVVWQLSRELIKIGHDVLIVNERDLKKTFEAVKTFDPDIIHLHYGKHFEIMPHFTCRKIATNYDGSFEASHKFHDHITRKFMYDCEFFCFRKYERKFFLKIGIAPYRIKDLPLGVEASSFKISNAPSKPTKTIYLGKIDDRKRQRDFQHPELNIDFVGPLADPKFNHLAPSYLGVWTHEEKFNNLTNYGNLALLSVSENGNPPLVCLEAMSAGLGIVISEASNEGVDSSLPFITVIPENKLYDIPFLSRELEKNREYSISHRDEIIAYARKRSWANIAQIYNNFL